MMYLAQFSQVVSLEGTGRILSNSGVKPIAVASASGLGHGIIHLENSVK